MMKLALVLVVALSACMHSFDLRPAETCATQGMVVGGMDGDDAQCRRALTPAEQCEIDAGNASAKARADYSTGPRNALLFVSYVALIVPGIVVHIVFNGERSGIEDDRDRELRARLARCGAVEQSGPPGM